MAINEPNARDDCVDARGSKRHQVDVDHYPVEYLSVLRVCLAEHRCLLDYVGMQERPVESKDYNLRYLSQLYH